MTTSIQHNSHAAPAPLLLPSLTQSRPIASTQQTAPVRPRNGDTVRYTNGRGTICEGVIVALSLKHNDTEITYHIRGTSAIADKVIASKIMSSTAPVTVEVKPAPVADAIPAIKAEYTGDDLDFLEAVWRKISNIPRSLDEAISEPHHTNETNAYTALMIAKSLYERNPSIMPSEDARDLLEASIKTPPIAPQGALPRLEASTEAIVTAPVLASAEGHKSDNGRKTGVIDSYSVSRDYGYVLYEGETLRFTRASVLGGGVIGALVKGQTVTFAQGVLLNATNVVIPGNESSETAYAYLVRHKADAKKAETEAKAKDAARKERLAASRANRHLNPAQ